MSIGLVRSNRVMFLAAIAAACRRWRQNRSRAICPKCRKHGEKLDSTAFELLRGGHPRAAVCMARMTLERTLVELCRDLPNYDGCQYGMHLAELLVFNQVITRRQFGTLSEAYSAASKVVHGKMLRLGEYEMIVARCQSGANWLRSLAPKKAEADECFEPALPERAVVVRGFAAMAGGAA